MEVNSAGWLLLLAAQSRSAALASCDNPESREEDGAGGGGEEAASSGWLDEDKDGSALSHAHITNADANAKPTTRRILVSSHT